MKDLFHRCVLLGAVVMLSAGCSRSEPRGNRDAAAKPAMSQAETNPAHDHSGWWCDEHGVPEEVCGQCSAKVAAACKRKGDWCKEHERPKSQCFVCDPKLRERFAAQYRAKYGKEPPPIEDEDKNTDGKAKNG